MQTFRNLGKHILYIPKIKPRLPYIFNELLTSTSCVNTLRLRRNIRHFAVDIFKWIFCLKMYEFRLKFNWSLFLTLTLSQCTLAGPVYTRMPLECHWWTQCTLGYHWATQRILAGYTGTPLEKLSWNSPTLNCHWRNLVESAPHWDATGETLTFAAYTGTPLEELWQPTHAPTHIVKHAE